MGKANTPEAANWRAQGEFRRAASSAVPIRKIKHVCSEGSLGHFLCDLSASVFNLQSKAVTKTKPSPLLE
jgi:hypothetical protein